MYITGISELSLEQLIQYYSVKSLLLDLKHFTSHNTGMTAVCLKSQLLLPVIIPGLKLSLAKQVKTFITNTLICKHGKLDLTNTWGRAEEAKAFLLIGSFNFKLGLKQRGIFKNELEVNILVREILNFALQLGGG